jgi:hypothetical protein
MCEPARLGPQSSGVRGTTLLFDGHFREFYAVAAGSFCRV